MSEKEITNDQLATMVAKGFDGVDKRFNEVDKRFNEVDKSFNEVDKRFDRVEKRLAVIEFEITELAHRAELEQLKTRIAKIEEKIGLA